MELDSKAGALKQMLLDILEDPDEIRRISIMGRNSKLKLDNGAIDCSVLLEKQIAEGMACSFLCFFVFWYPSHAYSNFHLERGSVSL